MPVDAVSLDAAVEVLDRAVEVAEIERQLAGDSMRGDDLIRVARPFGQTKAGRDVQLPFFEISTDLVIVR
jgi:hypothetical protein